jgi:tetrapyrrole methylase family protein / MazG family protein
MKKQYSYPDLLKIMTRLRAPGGCPWDREQTHASLIKHLKEESAEVVEAIKKKDTDNLCEELGDLLLQIVFHAQIASEKRQFDMAEVVQALCLKLVRRHPHVFGKASKMKDAAEVLAKWNDIKKTEKAARAQDIQRKRLAGPTRHSG